MKRIICVVLCIIIIPLISAKAKVRTESELRSIEIMVKIMGADEGSFPGMYYSKEKDMVIATWEQSTSYEDNKMVMESMDDFGETQEAFYAPVYSSLKKKKDLWGTDVPIACRMVSSEGVFMFCMVDGKYSTIDPEEEVNLDEKTDKLKGLAVLMEMGFLSVDEDFEAEAEYKPEENTIYVSLIAREITKEMWDEVIETAPQTETQIKSMLKESIETTTESIKNTFGYYDVDIVMMVKTCDDKIACKVTSNDK